MFTEITVRKKLKIAATSLLLVLAVAAVSMIGAVIILGILAGLVNLAISVPVWVFPGVLILAIVTFLTKAVYDVQIDIIESTKR